MNETQLLNKTIDLIDGDDTNAAYNYLVANKGALDSISGQVYNFLYCLAATSGKRAESLGWIEEAVLLKEMWYRPEVFEDDDLDSIRDDIRFKECCKKSEERYLEALGKAETICTWTKKTGNKLVLSLHGNQQNNEISKEHWDFLRDKSCQVEYIQSKELDSHQLYRWEDDGTGPDQLNNTLKSIEWESYDTRILCGFSSGCNTILRAIRDREINCNKVLLQSPWIPVVKDNPDLLVEQLKIKGIELLIICGVEDEDCISLCRSLEAKGVERGLNIMTRYIDGLGHDYPPSFHKLILDFI